MAHPLSVVEQAVRSFIVQWNSGLTPSLHLSTKPDGSISATSEVSSSTTTTTEAYISTPAINPRYIRRRSGYFARLRRRRNRVNQSKHETTESFLSNSEANDALPSSLPMCSEIPSVTVSDRSTMTSPIQMNLALQKISSLDIPPQNFTRPSKLTAETVAAVSIAPKLVYHPSVINACYSIIGKHPSQMTPEEVKQFDMFKQFKARNGESIENDVVFLPIGGIRTCLHCENPT